MVKKKKIETRGRKPLNEERLHRYTYALEPELVEAFKRLGDGKAVNGFRNTLLYIIKHQSIIEDIKSEKAQSMSAKDFDALLQSVARKIK